MMLPILVKESVPFIRRFWRVPGEIFSTFLTSLLFNHCICLGALVWIILLKSSNNLCLKLSKSSTVTTLIAIVYYFLFRMTQMNVLWMTFSPNFGTCWVKFILNLIWIKLKWRHLLDRLFGNLIFLAVFFTKMSILKKWVILIMDWGYKSRFSGKDALFLWLFCLWMNTNFLFFVSPNLGTCLVDIFTYLYLKMRKWNLIFFFQHKDTKTLRSTKWKGKERKRSLMFFSQHEDSKTQRSTKWKGKERKRSLVFFSQHEDTKTLRSTKGRVKMKKGNGKGK